eukprot:CAMPEP_0194444370 /NCGR_PEP_ID=MMETSP0176-20130528/127233_1 /TAXON_ID=216777 /ORGANISM="Proboscia alata, Strain PI-D3" /LENGTH=220 /DNA_ID=CAMNT_0039270741 /DNA_START=90 /DNA_END=752 /DNA_ORIENTATION=+
MSRFLRLRSPALPQMMMMPSASSSSAQRCCRRLFATKQPDWMVQAEMDAIAANKGGGGSSVMGKLENEFQGERVHNAIKLEVKLRTLIAKCKENRGDAKLFNAIRKRAIATQAEMDAIAANKGRQMNGGSSLGEVVMSKLEGEFQGERVHNAMKLENKLRTLIAKCKENRGDAKLFNAIRKRAIATRQELIVQREAAGMAKNSQQNTATVEATFPIPAGM